MKRFAPAFVLTLAILLDRPVHAQSSPSPEEPSAIRAPVTNYCEAYFTGDARRMEQTLHPHYLKHMIHGTIPVREKTGAQMVEEVRKNGPADLPAVRKMEEVTILDVAGVIASAKMVTPRWTNYLTLSKVDGQWKILSVVQRMND
jgi:Putative lumazine-binding